MTEVATPAAAPKLEIEASRQFAAWLAEQRIGLAFSTYRAGKLFLIGIRPDGRLSVFERSFARAMGLAAAGNTLYLGGLFQIWRFENALPEGATHAGCDRCYVPRVAYTTGDVDAHDLAVDGAGRLVFVNTLFSCLARVSETHSFAPLWQPPFISRLAAEDRCHLNGIAMADGEPAYATAVATTDLADGWRDHRSDGGVVIDLRRNEVVAEGLSMPHSPRVHRGRLYLLNSGAGEFGTLAAGGRFEPIAFCPGYLRGLAFAGDYAVLGLSKPRGSKTFAGLPLDRTMEKQGVAPRCGLYVVDLRTGDVVHWLKIEGVVEELYDVAVLAGAVRPMAIGLKSDEIRRVIAIDEPDPSPKVAARPRPPPARKARAPRRPTRG